MHVLIAFHISGFNIMSYKSVNQEMVLFVDDRNLNYYLPASNYVHFAVYRTKSGYCWTELRVVNFFHNSALLEAKCVLLTYHY